jgi:hypothetical protein
MKVFAFIVFCLFPTFLLAQIQVRVGDSVILVRQKISYSPGYGNCYIQAWTCNSPDIRANPANGHPDYEYSIYIKPTQIHIGLRYDTCSVSTLCFDTPPGTADWLLGWYHHTFVSEIIDSSLEVTTDESINSPQLSLVRLLPTPVVQLSTTAANRIRLDLVDVLGKTVSILADEMLPPGYYQYELDVPLGLYFIRLQSPTHRITLKVFVQ